MSQALSEEEFHRMQAQLLELRTQNYQLSDDLRKNSAELNGVRQKLGVLERDCSKAQKNVLLLLQEVDALLSENEMLQGKLHSQEEDFRLQNSTLMTELSKLCTQIEQLEQENQRLKEGTSVPSAAAVPVDAELLRLQAENSALQKKLKGEGGAAGAVGPFRVQVVTGRSQIVAKQAAVGWSAALCPITHCFGPELEMALNTEQEEKRLLREQVHTLEVPTQNRNGPGSQPCRTSCHSDRLLRRFCSQQQNRGWRFIHEADVIFVSRTKIDEINQRKEEELKAVNIRLQKLQSDLAAANQVAAELREQLQSKDKEHQLALHTLKDQVRRPAASQQQVDNILQENDALRTNLAALEQIQTAKTQEMNLLREQQEALTAELQQRRSDQESLLAQRDDLNSQLQESSFANRKLLEQLTEEGQEKERLLRELEEAKKTAEKRKAMLDEMATQLNLVKSDHKEALSDLKLQHEKEVLGVRARYEKELRGLHEEKNRSEEEIRQQLREEKGRTKELEGLQQRVEELQAQVQAMEGTKGWFERRLKETEENLEKNALQHQEDIQRLQEEQALQLEEKQAEVEGWKQQQLEAEKQRDELRGTIGKLKQEIKDTVDGQRILEKKGSSALKDLKRQLQLERKRADKLQERLQEILTNSRTRTGLEELVLSEINSPSRTQQTGDSSSVSSFSYKDVMKETQPTHQNRSGGGSPQSQRPAELSDDEVGELFQRLAEVQQEKWMLEEKVSSSPVSSALGAHGGFQAERGGLGSVLRDLVKPGDENLREMNKKLQNMLEEQLTKNMHLQKLRHQRRFHPGPDPQQNHGWSKRVQPGLLSEPG
uniref:GRIP1 associated protein 1 n=1 Tax=Fundulus heteroclitus TaxID=8078 RepID=A0A3Q2NMT6_FUNHE